MHGRNPSRPNRTLRTGRTLLRRRRALEQNLPGRRRGKNKQMGAVYKTRRRRLLVRKGLETVARNRVLIDLLVLQRTRNRDVVEIQNLENKLRNGALLGVLGVANARVLSPNRHLVLPSVPTPMRCKRKNPKIRTAGVGVKVDPLVRRRHRSLSAVLLYPHNRECIRQRHTRCERTRYLAKRRHAIWYGGLL